MSDCFSLRFKYKHNLIKKHKVIFCYFDITLETNPST